MLGNTKSSYGFITRLFHWGMALMILLTVLVALSMTEMQPGTLKQMLYRLHKATGILIFILAGFRLWWRTRYPVPELPADIPAWQQRLANSNIKLLYVIMFLMPVTGFMMSSFGGHPIRSYGLFTLPLLSGRLSLRAFTHEAHYWISIVFYLSFTAHVLGAFYHHFIRKDSVLMRIIQQQ